MDDTSRPPILICYDGSDGARRAIEAAADAYHHREAVVVCVWETFRMFALPFGAMPSTIDDTVRERAEHIAADGADIARSLGLGATGKAIHATRSTAHSILELLDENDFSAVVIGSQGHNPVTGALLGSVSNALVQRSPVPLLIVHPPRSAGATYIDTASETHTQEVSA